MYYQSPLSAFGLIKFFNQEEHYLSFLNGTSLFRTPHYYRQCEDKGRGDSRESCILYWDKNISDKKPTISMLDNSSTRYENYNDFESILIHPAIEQYDAYMQSWAIIGPHNGFENSLEQMKKEFGEYWVILPANNINRYVRLVEKASGNKVNYGAIQYSDNPMEFSLTVKSSIYSYQKEVRFFTGNCSKTEVDSKFFKLPKLKKLLLNAQTLKLELPDARKIYCVVGQKGVVTT
ncbi:hypothetical protein H8R01_16350 [Vibrio metschnikovii]|uniref:hypothetical protein n=1 Tax=Vibrio metschnikovii TaxID=28172 RepID=UPI0016489011|nr:hypothetical protein [Vibrio metschnikovii]MBC3618850.1 hypothetical protein [Vibrio metschnikovii]MBC5814866.1 hypothetical protein [Vibrio metschnikovii]